MALRWCAAGMVETDTRFPRVNEVVLTPDEDIRLLAFFPTRGTDAQEKLDLLRVIGAQDFRTAN